MKLSNVNVQMIKDFGGSNRYWTKTIQKTEVYRQVLDSETEMYLEGTIYVCDCLISELGLDLNKGKKVELNKEEITKIKEMAYMQYTVLIALYQVCGLSQKQITKLIDTTDLLEFIDASYEFYHIEGLSAILEDLDEHLNKEYGIKITVNREIPPRLKRLGYRRRTKQNTHREDELVYAGYERPYVNKADKIWYGGNIHKKRK